METRGKYELLGTLESVMGVCIYYYRNLNQDGKKQPTEASILTAYNIRPRLIKELMRWLYWLSGLIN
jgi:hypothetical protein